MILNKNELKNNNKILERKQRVIKITNDEQNKERKKCVAAAIVVEIYELKFPHDAFSWRNRKNIPVSAH